MLIEAGDVCTLQFIIEIYWSCFLHVIFFLIEPMLIWQGSIRIPPASNKWRRPPCPWWRPIASFALTPPGSSWNGSIHPHDLSLVISRCKSLIVAFGPLNMTSYSKIFSADYSLDRFFSYPKDWSLVSEESAPGTVEFCNNQRETKINTSRRMAAISYSLGVCSPCIYVLVGTIMIWYWNKLKRLFPK
jgi:hypothetical protein